MHTQHVLCVAGKSGISHVPEVSVELFVGTVQYVFTVASDFL